MPHTRTQGCPHGPVCRRDRVRVTPHPKQNSLKSVREPPGAKGQVLHLRRQYFTSLKQNIGEKNGNCKVRCTATVTQLLKLNFVPMRCNYKPSITKRFSVGKNEDWHRETSSILTVKGCFLENEGWSTVSKCCLRSFLPSLSAVIRVKPRVSYCLGKHSTIELYIFHFELGFNRFLLHCPFIISVLIVFKLKTSVHQTLSPS